MYAKRSPRQETQRVCVRDVNEIWDIVVLGILVRSTISSVLMRSGNIYRIWLLVFLVKVFQINLLSSPTPQSNRCV